MRRSLALTLACIAAGTAITLSACGPEAPDAQGKVNVVAAFYPLQYAAAEVGGANIDVTNLTQPGVEPHDIELSAAQVVDIANADLVVYIRGFQPAVDEAVDQQAADHSLDVSQGLIRLSGEAGPDPHVWLDPANMSKIGTAISDRLATIDPAKRAAFASNAKTFSTAMGDLSSTLSTTLADCAIKTLVVSHEAFGYLAKALSFTQVGISGLDPEAEPSPARIRDVANVVNQQGVTTIYYESLVDPKVAQTIADETGAKAVMLDPLEGLQPNSNGDYLTVMKANLNALKIGQKCS